MTTPQDIDRSMAWLRGQCHTLVDRARFTTDDGLVMYYPVVGGDVYPWFYLRDFTYMYRSAPEFFPPPEVRSLLTVLLRKIRADGWAPERITDKGEAIYRCHGAGDVIDSAPFFVALFKAYAEHTGDYDLIASHLGTFWKMLAALPREAETGLIWIDPRQPHTGYGFTDQIAKTGRELFCTLLVFEALTTLGEWAARLGQASLGEQCAAWCARIRRHLSLLWSDADGMFLAASADCRQIDIWGSVYAYGLGVATPARQHAMAAWLTANRTRFEYRGHLRHLPEPEYWQRIIPPHEGGSSPGRFQNGPYWSTPSGWFAVLLEAEAPGTGLEFLCDLVKTFQEIGVWEHISRNGDCCLRDNLSSALLPYGAFKQLAHPPAMQHSAARHLLRMKDQPYGPN